jgi:hypothetical protein
MSAFQNAHLLGDDKTKDDFDRLPDARLRKCNRKTFQGQFGLMSRVYCVNCGKPGGMITEELAATVYLVCDNCVDRMGAVPGAVQVPDHIIQENSISM